jgi:hypothetical protein
MLFMDLQLEHFNLAREWKDVIKVGYLDVSRHMDLALNYPLLDLPTLSLFNQGVILKSCSGPERFREIFQKLLAKGSEFPPFQPTR